MQMGEPGGAPIVSFSMAVAQRLIAGIGPHRKSGVIKKLLLPVDFACPYISKYHHLAKDSSS
jgi:hypothetical protein